MGVKWSQVQILSARRRSEAVLEKSGAALFIPPGSAVESSTGAIARCVGTLRRESGLQAPLVPPGGSHRVLHGKCAKRIQPGSAGQTARLARHPHYQSRTPDFPCARSDESPALADSRPVLIWETRAQGEPARLMVDRNFVLRWAHMGLGRRYPAIMDEQRRAHKAHIAEIQAEQEERMPLCTRSTTATSRRFGWQASLP